MWLYCLSFHSRRVHYWSYTQLCPIAVLVACSPVQAALLDWFVLGFHWLHNTVNIFIVTCIRPDVWNLIGELGSRKGYWGVSRKTEVASRFEKVADCFNKGPVVPFFKLWRLGKVWNFKTLNCNLELNWGQKIKDDFIPTEIFLFTFSILASIYPWENVTHFNNEYSELFIPTPFGTVCDSISIKVTLFNTPM